jgi:glutamine synthetase
MTKLLNRIADGKKTDDAAVKRALDLISKLPNLERDNTDRNRTSPFAFTGNKFEIRAVGSSQNCAGPMTVMNTMVGLQLLDFKADIDRLMGKGMEKDEAILMVLKKYIRKMRPILFEGNNYSQEWKEEAARRGLSNHANTPEALAVLASPQAEAFYVKSGVLSKKELEALLIVQLHAYCTKLDIEAKTLIEMVQTLVIPAVTRYQTELAQNFLTLKQVGAEDAAGLQRDILQQIHQHLGTIREGLAKLRAAQARAHEEKNLMAEARLFCYEVKPQMERIREAADELEGIVDDRYWPLVKYRELLFIR